MIEELNPFVREQKIEAFRYAGKKEILGTIGYDGQMTPGIELTKKGIIDRSNKVSIFMTPQNRKIYMMLSDPAHKLTRYIEGIIRHNNDIVKINTTKFMGEAFIKSRTTAYKAIEELCRYGFITKYHKQSYYWINPFMFFNGNRLVKYPNNVYINE